MTDAQAILIGVCILTANKSENEVPVGFTSIVESNLIDALYAIQEKMGTAELFGPYSE